MVFMKKILYSILAIFTLAISFYAQKGVDTQTQQIKQDGKKTTNTNNGDAGSSGRSFDWGKDKTKVRARLANPYKQRFDCRGFASFA